MTPADLARLIALAEAATALPFRREPRTRMSPYAIRDANGYLFAEVDDGQNAELLVEAANHVRALCVALREARELLQECLPSVVLDQSVSVNSGDHFSADECAVLAKRIRAALGEG